MAIAQSRMIALINAAYDYKQSTETLIDAIISAAAAAQSNPSHATALLLDLTTFANIRVLLKDDDTQTTLAVEYHHFRRNARRNDRLAQRQFNHRREAGVIPRSTTPRDTSLTAAKIFPPSVNIKKPSVNISPTYFNISAADRAAIMAEVNANHPDIPEPSCPACAAVSLDGCRLPNCLWHSRINYDSELSSQQGDPQF